MGTCRDASEAYRIIPLAKNQWPGVVIRLSEDNSVNKKPFALNMCTSFGKKSSGGLFGLFGDALLDILCAEGIGPSLQWVDDFLFLAIEWQFIEGYSTLREKKKTSIEQNGSRLQKGGHFWYRGNMLPSDLFEEFAEDMSMPLKNLSQLLKSTPEDLILPTQ